MEDKIEVGEYVRTDKGYIRKEVTQVFLDMMQEGKSSFGKPLKHSKNIIDLIEEGDYVNGSEVITVYGYDEDGNDKDGLGICEVDDDYAYYSYLENIEIKSIVTKEQFNSVKYEVEKC